jgi:molybdenum cofactor synthesis domain-containing protein
LASLGLLARSAPAAAQDELPTGEPGPDTEEGPPAPPPPDKDEPAAPEEDAGPGIFAGPYDKSPYARPVLSAVVFGEQGAASVGVGELPVLRRPRVAILCTGDELAMPGEPLKPGALYNSNRYTLRALAETAGCAVTDLGNVPDQLGATREALRQAAAGHDLIVTSGGVSVGEEDHLTPAAQAEGRLENWQLAIKPGKPLAFGAIRRADGSEALLVGLPGNPVSSFVTWLLAVREVLAALQGLPAGLPPALPMEAGFDWPKPDKRREFLRVRVGADSRLVLFANQGSGVLTWPRSNSILCQKRAYSRCSTACSLPPMYRSTPRPVPSGPVIQ